MSDRTDVARRLQTAARAAALARSAIGPDPALTQAVAVVKAWQGHRLSQTHADLLHSERYGPAARFFVEELYSVQDLSRRDQELARVIPSLIRLMPVAALGTIADALELDALSEDLDHRMGQQWARFRAGTGVGIGGGITASQYASLYHAVGDRAARERQLQLVDTIGHSLDRLVRLPLLSGMLKSMGPAARAAGFGGMHGFLMRGFVSFKAMRGASEFLQLILTRERACMEQWLAAPDAC